MGFEKPSGVLKIIRASAAGDDAAREHHLAMSRKGGFVSAENRERKKEEKAAQIREAAIHEATWHPSSEGGDILPPDPSILESLE